MKKVLLVSRASVKKVLLVSRAAVKKVFPESGSEGFYFSGLGGLGEG